MTPPKISRNEFLCFVEPKISNTWKSTTSLKSTKAKTPLDYILLMFLELKGVIYNLELLAVVFRALLDVKI